MDEKMEREGSGGEVKKEGLKSVQAGICDRDRVFCS